MVEVENLTAVQNIDGSILGHLMWFSVGKQLIKTDDLEQLLVQSGLDNSWMPNPIRVTDAFRRSTKEVEQRKVTSQAGVYENYLIREVFSDSENVQRNIVIETVDQTGKKLKYDSDGGIITLDKKNGNISFVATNESSSELCREAEKRFNIYKDHYSAQQLRVMVSKILQSLAPTPVRPNGGIYFVPDSHTKGLNALIKFTSSLQDSEGFKVPVVNTFDNKQMVNKKLSDHLNSLLEECKGGSGLSKGQIKSLVRSANSVIEDYKNYRNIVESENTNFEDMILKIRSEVGNLVSSLEG